MTYQLHKTELEEEGYSVVSDIYSVEEIKAIVSCIEQADSDGLSFLKSKDLFAVRQLLTNVPALKPLLFNSRLLQLITELFGGDKYFITKAIYFDKPSGSNWFVSYHQDLSVSVDRKLDIKGYENWTVKKEQYGVQPPVQILENTVTVRVHLDDTDENNGALKVIPQSHLNGIVRTDSPTLQKDNEAFCKVSQGGVMLMKPLTFHASNKTVDKRRRRVIHLELNRYQLEEPLKWLEYNEI